MALKYHTENRAWKSRGTRFIIITSGFIGNVVSGYCVALREIPLEGNVTRLEGVEGFIGGVTRMLEVEPSNEMWLQVESDVFGPTIGQ